MATSTSLPESTSPLYCSDEDIIAVAGGDWSILIPQWQQMAYGTDGVFAANAPWVLTSATIDFQSNGVVPNQVIQLTTPKNLFPGSAGHFFAIDSVTGNSVTLRRVYRDLNVGQPPAPATGLSGVTFTINTLLPQIDNATFDLKRRFAIDDTIGVDFYRSSAWVYDLRDFRMATVYTVLLERYMQETRTDVGDFAMKIKRIKQQLDDVIARVQIRFGPYGASSEPSSIFSCKLSR